MSQQDAASELRKFCGQSIVKQQINYIKEHRAWEFLATRKKEDPPLDPEVIDVILAISPEDIRLFRPVDLTKENYGKALKAMADNRNRGPYYFGIFDVPEEFRTEEMYLDHFRIWRFMDSPKSGRIPAEHVTEKIYAVARKDELHYPSHYFPIKFHSTQEILYNIHHNHCKLSDVPEDKLDANFYYGACKHGMLKISDVPIQYRTQGLYIIAVANDGKDIINVPSEMIDETFCQLVAVRTDIIPCIPSQFRTAKFYEQFLSNTVFGCGGYRGSLSVIPEEYWKEYIVRQAATRKPYSKDIPLKLRTPEICSLMLCNDPELYDEIPSEIRTVDFMRDAVEKTIQQNNYTLINLITPTDEDILYYAKHCKAVIKYMSRTRYSNYKWNLKIIELMVLNQADVLPSLEILEVTDEKKNGQWLFYNTINGVVLDEEVVKRWIMANPEACDFFLACEATKFLRTDSETMFQCVTKHGSSLHNISLVNEYAWKAIFKCDGLLLKHLPNTICKHTYRDLSSVAIAQNPLALEFCADKTAELCLQAVKANKEAVKFVPEIYR
jgi:hypothetical protein